MKHHQAARAVTESGNFERQKMGMILDSVSFRIMTDEVYPNKPKALLREYGNNAYDSHIEAGKPKKPFLVILPTALSPYLVIEDEGVGLSHEDVMYRFGHMGASTKRDSNKAVGKFGWGCKVGLAYKQDDKTEDASFTIESRFEGMIGTYLCTLDEDFHPYIVLMSTEHTDKPNGITIKVAIQSKDFTTFRVEAKKVYKHFDPFPIVKGGGDFKLEPQKFVAEGKGWGMRAPEDGRQSWQRDKYCYAIMGNSPYKIESCHLPGITQELTAILDLPVNITFPIGSFDVTPARDQISYNARSIKNVLSRLKTINLEVELSLTKQIAESKTLYEARIKYKELSNTLSQLGQRSWVSRDKIKWRDQHCGGSINIHTAGMDSCTLCYIDHDRVQLNRIPIRCTYEERFSANKDIKFLWDDISMKDNQRRLKHYFETDGFCPIVVIKTPEITELKIVLAEIGTTEYTRIADLPDPPELPSTRRGSYPKTEKLYAYNGKTNKDFRLRDNWSTTTKTVAEGGVYIPLFNWTPPRKNFTDIMTQAARAGVAPDDVFGIPASHKNIPKRNPGWVEFENYIQKAVLDEINNHELWLQVANTKAMSYYSNAPCVQLATNLNSAGLVPTKVRSKFTKVMKAVKIMEATDSKKMVALLELVKMLDINFRERKPSADLAHLLTLANAAYPLVRHFCDSDKYAFSGGRDNNEAFLEYINAID